MEKNNAFPCSRSDTSTQLIFLFPLEIVMKKKKKIDSGSALPVLLVIKEVNEPVTVEHAFHSCKK